MFAIESCRAEILGSRIESCDQCGYTKVQDKQNEVFPFQYFHTVFTMPSQLVPLVLRNKKVMYKLLFDKVKETLLSVAEEEKYFIGFEKGVKDWRRYLKKDGFLVASEITWISDSRPAEIQTHWDKEYPEINLTSAKIRVLEKHGYSPIGYFGLPEHCWREEYYRPMQARFDDFLSRNGNSKEACEIVAAERHESDLYERDKALVEPVEKAPFCFKFQ